MTNPTCQIICSDAIQLFQSMKQNVQLVIGSPPYEGKMKRYHGTKLVELTTQEWIDWMADVTRSALSVCDGDVVWIVNGRTENYKYIPSVEGLVWTLYQKGIHCERPAIWKKNGSPGAKNWFRNDHEHILCFTHGNKRRTFNWEAIAEPPKYANGGKFNQRDAKGNYKQGGSYPQLKLARPSDMIEIEEVSDIIRVPVGGGMMGSSLSKKSEAAFPEKLVEKLILVLTNEGDYVSDCFLGSGTVAKVSLKHKRNFIGGDIRQDQCDVALERIKEV